MMASWIPWKAEPLFQISERLSTAIVNKERINEYTTTQNSLTWIISRGFCIARRCARGLLIETNEQSTSEVGHHWNRWHCADLRRRSKGLGKWRSRCCGQPWRNERKRICGEKWDRARSRKLSCAARGPRGGSCLYFHTASNACGVGGSLG